MCQIPESIQLWTSMWLFSCVLQNTQPFYLQALRAWCLLNPAIEIFFLLELKSRWLWNLPSYGEAKGRLPCWLRAASSWSCKCSIYRSKCENDSVYPVPNRLIHLAHWFLWNYCPLVNHAHFRSTNLMKESNKFSLRTRYLHSVYLRRYKLLSSAKTGVNWQISYLLSHWHSFLLLEILQFAPQLVK